MVEMTGICKNCKKEFVRVSPMSVNQKYCSKECCYIANEKLKPKITKACPWCHAEFETALNQRFCSKECGHKYNKMKKHVGNLDFSHDFLNEMAKLEQLGRDYQLPIRSVE